MGITAPIVFVTDLDGTLLDHDTYEAGPAARKVIELQDAAVAVVCCSAKTRAEQDWHRRALGICGRFVVENGAAVHDEEGAQRVLGLPYPDVRDRLRQAAADLDVELRGFGDMDTSEIAARTGLSSEAAERARARDHTEPFVVEAGELGEAMLRDALRDVELHLQRGARFWTAGGNHDKGAAVTVLRELFTVDHGERPMIYAIGDTHNDTAMLAAADIAMLVQRPDGTWADLDVEHVTHLDGIGPSGWCEGADLILAAARS